MNEKIKEISLLYSEKGAMITQAQTSRLLSKSRARIAQMIEEGKLEAVNCLGINMITLSSIIQYVKTEKKPTYTRSDKNIIIS